MEFCYVIFDFHKWFSVIENQVLGLTYDSRSYIKIIAGFHSKEYLRIGENTGFAATANSTKPHEILILKAWQ